MYTNVHVHMYMYYVFNIAILTDLLEATQNELASYESSKTAGR